MEERHKARYGEKAWSFQALHQATSSDLFRCLSTCKFSKSLPFGFLLEDSLHRPEKAMATHSSTFAWKIPWMEEPGGLPSMGSHRIGHD